MSYNVNSPITLGHLKKVAQRVKSDMDNLEFEEWSFTLEDESVVVKNVAVAVSAVEEGSGA